MPEQAPSMLDDISRPPRVAVLDDDDVLRDDILVPGLAAHGFEVEGFARSVDLYRRLLGASFEAVVLDIGLPDEDGLSVARHLRKGSSIGIVMLTGRGSVAERLQALGEAADAWLSKPVEVAVVAATVASLVRRMRMQQPAQAPTNERRWRLGAEGWRLHAPSDRSVALSRSERRLLECLFAADGEPVSREQLIAELGESRHEFDPHRIEMLVHRLRRKVAGELGEALPLRSVRGSGYVLIARDSDPFG